MQYKSINGHIIVDAFNGRELVLDTGSHRTFPHNSFGLSSHKLSQYVGHKVDGIMGMSAMEDRVVSIDRANKEVHMTGIVPDYGTAGIKVPMSNKAGTPMAWGKVNGERVNLFFDTGAPVSYAPKRLVADRELLGTVTDFYPFVGRFKTPVVASELEVGIAKTPFNFGHLPLSMGWMLRDMAIVGTELLKHCDVTFDFIKREIHLHESGHHL